MTDTQIKSAAIAKLKSGGIDASFPITMSELARLIEQHTGVQKNYRNSAGDLVAAYAFPPNPRPMREFREVKEGDEIPMGLGKHWRQADIDAAQPPVMTPRGTGNWTEHSQLWRR